MKHPLAICSLILALNPGLPPRAWSAITVVNPGAADHTAKSTCPAADGSNELNPDPVTYLAPPAAGAAVLAELGNGQTKFAGWNFAAGAALSGTLTINHYHSQFVATHRSGANILATYVPGKGDPATLRFVQLVDTSDPAAAKSPYIDPFPNDDTLPFYYTEAENKVWGLKFSDFSKRTHRPTSAVTWRGNLYLVSWNGATPGNVTVHDGIRWGFDAGCAKKADKSLTLTTALGTPVLSWPVDAEGYWLESSTSLSPGAVWEPRTNGVVKTDTEYRFAISGTNVVEFFRLAADASTSAPPVIQAAYVRLSPPPQTVEQGHEVYLSVKADGTPPIAYQWYKDGFAIPGATGRELSYVQCQLTDQGVYAVSVTNSAGGEMSDPAPIQIIPDITPPTLVSAVASSNLFQITLTFSEPINPATALNPGQFQVLSEQGPVIIAEVQTGPDDSSVILTPTPSTPLLPANQYFVQVNGVSDFATPPNFMMPGPGSQTTFTTPPGPGTAAPK